MKDLIVVMGASAERGTMKQYLGQLVAAGIDAHVEHLLSFENTLGACVGSQMALTEKFQEYKRLVFSDAFDVQFYGSKADVLAKVPINEVLLAGERNCYPDPSLASDMPGNTAWRFVNGGLMAGTPTTIRLFLSSIAAHPLFNAKLMNQEFYNRLKHLGQLPAKVDESTNLFYCLYHEQVELQSDHGLPLNTVCQSRPQFIHANGGSRTSVSFGA